MSLGMTLIRANTLAFGLIGKDGPHGIIKICFGNMNLVFGSEVVLMGIWKYIFQILFRVWGNRSLVEISLRANFMFTPPGSNTRHQTLSKIYIDRLCQQHWHHLTPVSTTLVTGLPPESTTLATNIIESQWRRRLIYYLCQNWWFLGNC